MSPPDKLRELLSNPKDVPVVHVRGEVRVGFPSPPAQDVRTALRLIVRSNDEE